MTCIHCGARSRWSVCSQCWDEGVTIADVPKSRIPRLDSLAGTDTLAKRETSGLDPDASLPSTDEYDQARFGGNQHGQ